MSVGGRDSKAIGLVTFCRVACKQIRKERMT